MNNTHKIIIVVILIILIWFFVKKSKAKNGEASLLNPPSQPPVFLTIGSSGPMVKQLQLKLNDIIRDTVKRNSTLYCTYEPGMDAQLVGELNVDGIFGPKTACALKAITGKTGINSDEIENIKLSVALNSVILDKVLWE